MQVLRNELEAIEKVFNSYLPKGAEFNALTEDAQNAILDASIALVHIRKRWKKANERTAKYVAEKRKINPNFAR